MDNDDYPSRGGCETLAAQRNNIRPTHGPLSAADVSLPDAIEPRHSIVNSSGNHWACRLGRQPTHDRQLLARGVED
jgi:hypothetical protein